MALLADAPFIRLRVRPTPLLPHDDDEEDDDEEEDSSLFDWPVGVKVGDVVIVVDGAVGTAIDDELRHALII